MNGGIVFVGLGYILEKIILSKNCRPAIVGPLHATSLLQNYQTVIFQ